MAIEVQCPTCKKRMKVSDAMAGRTGKCPDCQGKIVVPGGASPPAEAFPQVQTAPPPNVKVAKALPADFAISTGPKASGQTAAPQVVSATGTMRSVSKSNEAAGIRRWYQIWLGSMIGAMLVGGVMIYMLMSMLPTQAEMERVARGPDPNKAMQQQQALMLQKSGFSLTTIVAIGGSSGLLSLVNFVAFCVLFYKMWAVMRAGPVQTTPGKAVGFMFIPLFNLYWMFVAIAGLPKNLNRFAKTRQLAVPPASEGMALTACILNFVPLVSIVNVVLMPMAIASMARTAESIAKANSAR